MSNRPPPWFLERFRDRDEPAAEVRQGPAPVVSILVPFRDDKKQIEKLHGQNRTRHLYQFLGAMRLFLHGIEGANFLVLVVKQMEHDGYKFNRGKLLNAGFTLAREIVGDDDGPFRHLGAREFASVIFHDCDLLPSFGLASYYKTPPKPHHPVHLSPPYLFDQGKDCKYRHDDNRPGKEQFFGGVTAMCPDDFEACNGFPSDLWGWGQEDDQLLLRLKKAGVLERIERPKRGEGTFVDGDMMALQTSSANTSDFVNDHVLRGNDYSKFDTNWRKARGLNDTSFKRLPPGLQPIPFVTVPQKGLRWSGESDIPLLEITVDIR